MNAKVPGEYSIKYLVEDSVGNKAEAKVRNSQCRGHRRPGDLH